MLSQDCWGADGGTTLRKTVTTILAILLASVALALPVSASLGEAQSWFRVFGQGTALAKAAQNSALLEFAGDLPNRRIIFFFDGNDYCAGESLAVVIGWTLGVVEQTDALEIRDGLNTAFFIDGTPLADLTRVHKTPARFSPVSGTHGFAEGGVFRPDELAGLIGLGGHTLRSEIDLLGLPTVITSTFNLLNC